MKQFIIQTLFLLIMLCSCGSNQKETDKVEMVKTYVQALNDFDYPSIISLFYDSVRMKEIVYDMSYSKADYYHLFQWDSIFQPQYEILKIQEMTDGTIDLEISKKGPRILFLNEKPTVTHEVISFKNDKIHSVHIRDYLVFDDQTWEAKRQKLLDFIDQHHPELNGFIYDQTKQGALNYLKALELYRAAND